MTPVPFKMVDLGGIDLVEIDGTAVPGIYNKILGAYNTCRVAILCNWFFAGILLPPAHVLITMDDDVLMINDVISVESDDVLSIPGLTPSVVIEALTVTENDTYTPGPGVNGFSPVFVDVPGPVLVQLTATENETYLPGTGEDGFSSVVVNVPTPVPQNPTIVPVYSGLSYSYVGGSSFIEYTTKTNYLLFFEITAGDYIVFLDSPIGNRFRSAFFSGKDYSDFEQYVENPGSGTIYNDGTSIVNTSQTDEIERRYKFTASSSGTLVVMTSSNSQAITAYLMKQTD